MERITRRPRDPIELWHAGRQVVMAEVIPTEATDVEFRWVPDRGARQAHAPETQVPCPGQAGARGSADPPDDPPTEEDDPRNYQRGYDMDMLYFDYPGPRGEQYRLELGTYDLDYHTSWDDVTTAELEVALQRTYPALFSRSTRVAIAVHNRLLREYEHIAHFQAQQVTMGLFHVIFLGEREQRVESVKMEQHVMKACGAGEERSWA